MSLAGIMVELWAKGGEIMPTKQNEWKKKNTIECRTTITKSSEIVQALEKALQDSGKSTSEYTRMAIVEKLQNDGYLQAAGVYAGPHGTLKLPND